MVPTNRDPDLVGTATTEWKPAKLSEIHKGLTTLWSGMGGATATRVCTTNLIVFLDGRSRLDEAIEVSRLASEEHPFRAIFLIAEPEAEEHAAQGQVSGHCRLTDSGDVHICCEQIVLTATGQAVERLPASVAGLLVPDLPVILWWMGIPHWDDAMDRLIEISDRLIVDSREFADISLMRKPADEHPQIGLGDLNWIRIRQWREMTAEIFDDTRFLPYLSQVEKLDVRYADGKGDPSQAWLYAGWFVSRTSQTNLSIEALEGIPTEPCNLAAVNILSADRKAFFSLAVNAKHEIEVIAEVEGEPAYYRTSPVESLPLGGLLAAEIEEGPDAIYRDALITGYSLPGGSQ